MKESCHAQRERKQANGLASSVSKAGKRDKQKAKNEGKKFIEDLFSKNNAPKVQISTPEPKTAKQKESCKQPRHKSTGNKSDLFGIEENERKKTEEGWNIYTEDELKLNKKGGDTPLCPFDCDCCY